MRAYIEADLIGTAVQKFLTTSNKLSVNSSNKLTDFQQQLTFNILYSNKWLVVTLYYA